MPRDLLIDGYNLMHAAGLARASYGPGDLERCRLRLLSLLAGFLGEEGCRRTTVVFDAKSSPPDGTRQDMFKGILIEYSPTGQEADDVIESLIRRHSAPKQLLVVSSDHRLHKAARRRRAHARDSDQFLEDCERRARKHAPSPPVVKPGDELSPAAIEAWLVAFGDVDPEAIRAELAASDPPPTATQPMADVVQEPEGPREVADAGTMQEDELEFWQRRVDDVLDGE
jgi:predicted RNA-binding protein with PIN domain